MDASIDNLHRVAARQAGTLSLAGGLPMASLFPRDLLGVVGFEATRDPSGTALQYGWPQGSEGLRRWIAADLVRRGAAVSADDVIVKLERATALGTSFDPGSLFRRDEGSRAFAMRLSPCNVPEASIDHAVTRLARAVGKYGRGARGEFLRRPAHAAMP